MKFAGARVAAAEALPDLREDVGEDEHEEQRLHDRAHHELAELAAEHAHVPREHGDANGADGSDRVAALIRGTPGRSA